MWVVFTDKTFRYDDPPGRNARAAAGRKQNREPKRPTGGKRAPRKIRIIRL